MLPKRLRPRGFGGIDREAWDNYRRHHGVPQEGPQAEFYRQVIYDHFDHFNAHYPWFDLEESTFKFQSSTVKDLAQDIRYFRNSPVDWWHTQFDQYHAKNQNYIIYQRMIKERTFPFPIIIMDCHHTQEPQLPAYGQPLHLVEGTHRLSYLFRMSELGLVEPDSMHQYVFIKPVIHP